MLSLIYSIIFCVAISLADMGPTFEKDQDGSAIIDLPQEYWKNKTYRSLKIHLSKEVLQNLTGKRFHENEVKPKRVSIKRFHSNQWESGHWPFLASVIFQSKNDKKQ